MGWIEKAASGLAARILWSTPLKRRQKAPAEAASRSARKIISNREGCGMAKREM